MWQNAQDAYLENRILSGEPLELVHVLYQACTGAVRDARRHLAEAEIASRARSISKACEILAELMSSLDHERGGEISERLAQLYDYMQRRLIEANCRQTDEPLTDVLGLLATLSEAWEGIKQQARPELAESSWTQPLHREAEPAYASAGWSF
jgi:flagellar protein FliS